MVPQDILLEKSLIDCHCLGMDSLVIKDNPGMVRMFIARPSHELHYNYPGGAATFSVALHRHHCDVTLMPVLGKVFNVTPTDVKSVASIESMRSYRYTSPIIKGEGQGKFEAVDGDNSIPIALKLDCINHGPLFMKANALHTIYVPKGEVAAWFIWEGRENPNHSPIVYSNRDLLKFDLSKLDKPMTMTRLREDLEIIGVR